MFNLKNKFLSYQLKKVPLILIFLLVFLMLFVSCHSTVSKSFKLAEVEQLVHSGKLKKAELIVDSVKATGTLTGTDWQKLDSIIETGRRIRLDFCLTEDDTRAKLINYYPDLDTNLLQQWERTHKLEVRTIDGEKRYFKNAVSNLFLLDDSARNHKIKVDGFQLDSLDLFCIQRTRKIISATKVSGETVLPVHMKLNYTIQVKPNAVPDGETIRCWMPFPREGNARQKNGKLLKSDPEKAVVASEDKLQRSVYLERKAVKDQPTTFQIEFEVETSAQYFDLNSEDIKPYNTASAVYREYTSERAPQILFSEKIRRLGDRIVAGETNPLKKVQKIYDWINDSIRWASALEYSIIPNIPEYVLETSHGDCGMQTLLFMTLARSQGIPVKWQSGWMLHPRHVNLHDWCEVFYEGIGWVPLDQSFGLQNDADEKVHHFYRSGIDSYRLIVNDDYARELSPKKKYMRSEPYDFQRGELEWEGGNLYFDRWSWHMDVEYK